MRRGFTLLEMIVATVILAVAIVGLLSGISTAMRNAARLTAYDRVVQLARLRMNDLLTDSRLPHNSVVSGDFDSSLTGGVNAGWQARLTRFEMPPNPAPFLYGLDRIELQIWWMAGNQRRNFTLDGYRSSLICPEELAAAGP